MRVEVEGSSRVEVRTVTRAAVQGTSPTAYQKLKPGPGQSPEDVRASQGERIRRAMIDLAGESGFEAVTVRSLTRWAGVSSRTFYGHFPNREACLASTVDSVGHEFLRQAALNGAGQRNWEDKIRASLDALFRDFADRPKAARLVLVEALAAGRPARTASTKLTSDLERLLGRVLSCAPVASEAPERLVVGIAAGVVRVATMTTITGRAGELPQLVDGTAAWVFDTYEKQIIDLCTRAERRSDKRIRQELPSRSIGSASADSHGEDERILAAAARLAIGKGFNWLTVSKIRREAGVSRRDFDARFADATECFLAALGSLAQKAACEADSWAAETGEEKYRSHRTMLALCALVARNQPHARLVMAKILVPGRPGLLRREQLISTAARQLRRGPDGRGGGALAAEASVAAAWRIAQREVAADRANGLQKCAPLLSLLVGGRHSQSKFDFARPG